ncbi:MAG: crotonase/enoyl-CoA hydratase family protein [Deltaproteobacteria bacterium]|nr:MAG: crotonase/enoyl-CoA hydratase family protein [Deltaproteobacteria bacterium]
MPSENGNVRVRIEDKVAVVEMDDGKANALSPDLIAELHAALDRAEQEATATLLVGRPGRFSAGFDLARMTASAESARDLVSKGAELILRMYVHPQPLVVACTGHALAAGALLLLAADQRIGAEGNFKIGLNEVAIGLRLPIFAVELARQRLSKRHLTAATVLARVYDPQTAVDAGYLDRTVAPEALTEESLSLARALAELPLGAHRETKRALRGAMVESALAGLADDMKSMGVPAKAPGGS